MGRKGIGKLSLFSIANTVEVFTVKDNMKSAFRMQADDIKKRIEGKRKLPWVKATPTAARRRTNTTRVRETSFSGLPLRGIAHHPEVEDP